MKVNGNVVVFIEGRTILDILKCYNLDVSKVVVEVNKIILDVDEYNSYKVNKEDIIEIISFVGGG